MNNNDEILDDILDESQNNISKPQTNSNFQMPSDISEAYNQSVNEIAKSKEVQQNVVNNNITQTEVKEKNLVQTTPIVEKEPQVSIEPSIVNNNVNTDPTLPNVRLVSETTSSVVQNQANNTGVEQTQQQVVINPEQTSVMQQTVPPVQQTVTSQANNQTAEQTSVLPIVENSVIPEKPVKKKGKVIKIVILLTLLIVTLAALAIYIIGIDQVRDFLSI